jgi:2-octaprenyl-6-methoxyphenol hydroxylase
MQKVAVVGMGLNGMLSAIAIKKTGFEVDIIEGKIPDFNLDKRTSVLTFETIKFLKNLEIYESLKPHITPIFHIYSFEEHMKPVLNFDSGEVGENPFGFVIHNYILKEILFIKIQELKINIIEKTFEKIESNPNFINIFDVNYKLLISCAGRNDKLKSKENIKTLFNLPYFQSAFVFNIKHEKPHNNIAVESFNASGPLAILPLQDSLESAVILTVKDDSAEFLKQTSDVNFLNIFKENCKRMRHIGEIEKITSEIKSYELSLVIAKTSISDRIMFMGDSYNIIHPIAGQAFNMSVKDIKNLYLHLQKAFKLGLDIGSHTFLNEIYRKNIRHHVEMNLFTHALVKIFSNNSLPLKIIRNMGVRFINEITPLKKFLMKKASGV